MAHRIIEDVILAQNICHNRVKTKCWDCPYYENEVSCKKDELNSDTIFYLEMMKPVIDRFYGNSMEFLDEYDKSFSTFFNIKS